MKEIKIDSSFEIKEFTAEETRRFIRDVFWPYLEKKKISKFELFKKWLKRKLK